MWLAKLTPCQLILQEGGATGKILLYNSLYQNRHSNHVERCCYKKTEMFKLDVNLFGQLACNHLCLRLERFALSLSLHLDGAVFTPVFYIGFI